MHTTIKKQEAGKFSLIGGVIGALVILPILAIGVLIATFDANKYREEISTALTQQLGRDVKLGGAMGLSISSGGLVLTVADVSVGNPSWASRKEMAKIGSLEMQVAIAPLLQREVQIQRFQIGNADTQLEQGGDGKGNWEFAMKNASQAAASTAEETPGGAKQVVKSQQGQAVSLAVDELSVKNSTFAFKGKDGKTTAVKFDDLSVQGDGKQVVVDAKGQMNAQDFSVNLKGGTLKDLSGGKEWPLDIKAKLAAIGINAIGKMDGARKNYTFNQIELDLPQGKLAGHLNIVTGGVRPRVSGKLNAEKFTLAPAPAAASTAPATEGQPAAPEAKPQNQGGRLFSDQPFDVSALRSADATIDLTIGQIESGKMTLDQVTTKVVLEGGRLRLEPIDFSVAGNKFDANAAVDASGATPQVAMTLKGYNLDTQAILAKLGQDKLVVGKANFDMNISGAGNSPRAIASTLGGNANLEIGNGSIPPEGMKLIASNALAKMLPGAEGLANVSLTCVSTKFQASQGVMRSQGLLIDTSLGTVAGAGGVNLRDETIDMVFQPAPREANLSQIASLPVRATGPLSKPSFGLEAAGAAKSLASNLLGVNIPQTASGGLQVPVVDAKAPGNPCTKALANPVYVQQQQKPGLLTPQVEDAKKVVNEKVKGLTDELSKGLGGLFGGQPAAQPAPAPAPAQQ